MSAVQFIHIIFLLSAVGFAGCVSLGIIAIRRRVKRERDLKALGRSREYVRSVLQAMLNDGLEYSAGLSLLRATRLNGNRRLAEQLLFQDQTSPKTLPILQRLAQDLGLIRDWQSRLEDPARDEMRRFRLHRPGSLRRLRFFAFLARARNADHLGRVHHHASWRLLANALNDPNSDVQAVALRSLARIGEAQSFPFLIERARAAASSAVLLPERELIAALASFPPQMAHQLSPLLEERNPRLRLIAANVLREMARLRASPQKDLLFVPDQFGPEVSNWILTRLPQDQNPDIRATDADLLGYFRHEARARQELARLMRDEEWYVRLHAVRAAGRLTGSQWILPVSARLTDTHWRVREAASRALAGSGSAGVHQLLTTFLGTEDAYAREQIAEQLEISGITADLTAHYGEAGYELESKVLDAMTKMGRPQHLPSTRSQALEDRNGEPYKTGSGLGRLGDQAEPVEAEADSKPFSTLTPGFAIDAP
jgi:HEAT repeat protein